MACMTFALNVQLGYGCDTATKDKLNSFCHVAAPPSALESFASSFFSSTTKEGEKDLFFIASASKVELTTVKQKQSTALVAILVPPSLIDELMEKFTSSAKMHAAGSCFWLAGSSTADMSQELLNNIHSALRKGRIRGIVRTSIAAENNAPAEFLLLELPPKEMLVNQVLQATGGQPFNAEPTAILKILPISNLEFNLPVVSSSSSSSLSLNPRSAASSSSQLHPRAPSIPTCAVCIHRIDPIRLGLPAPQNEHLCSKFCPPPNLISWASEVENSCPKQRYLLPWKKGARCQTCQIVEQYWDFHNNARNQIDHDILSDNDNGINANANNISVHSLDSRLHHDDVELDGKAKTLFCAKCAMHKTLWVCMTCGFIGCGRYSNRHSVQHFQETQHPYSLELATLRIWDYLHEDSFAHRVDLLECPSSPTLTHPWVTQYCTPGESNELHRSSTAAAVAAAPSPLQEKSPKKATLIGAEYEALLQTALEDQAQYYEGEMARLRAELTNSLFDKATFSAEDQSEVQDLKDEIGKLREEISGATQELLNIQAEEAAQRSSSHQLLKEQQVATVLVKKIKEESLQEAQRGNFQVQDLEQQIHDLKTNLRMRQEFSQNEELNEAQIFGTHETQRRASSKKGKKKGRFFRK